MPDRMERRYDNDGELHDEHEDRPDLIKQRARVILLDRIWRTFLAGMLIVLLAFVGYDIVVGHATREQIADCTIPGGDCYQDGQKRTGEVLIDIGEIIRLTVACADRQGPQTEEQIKACVLDGLE